MSVVSLERKRRLSRQKLRAQAGGKFSRLCDCLELDCDQHNGACPRWATKEIELPGGLLYSCTQCDEAYTERRLAAVAAQDAAEASGEELDA